MRKLYNKKLRFFARVLGVIIFAVFTGCQDDLLETEIDFDSEGITLKSAKANNFMVISKSETLPEGLVNELASLGEIVKTIPEIGIAVVKTTAPNFKTKVSKLSDVQSVVADLSLKWLEPVKVFPMASPPSIGDDEEFFPFQWGLDAIDAPEAWNAGFKGEGAKVFILDSGIDAEHPDLSPNLNTTLSKSFVPDEDWNIQPGFYFNHGTHVAGIIAAADNIATDLNTGVIGVAPKAEIVAVKVLSESDGSGYFSWVIEGVVYAALQGADVINMSLGTVLNTNGFVYDEEGNLLGRYAPQSIQDLKHAMQKAIDFATRSGATVVAAAGNDYMNADGNGSAFVLPADLNNVISVSATAPLNWAYDQTTDLDEIASYSNTGRSLVDISAPGGDFDSEEDLWYYDMIYSTISGGWSFASGTSMASPHVAGVAALIIAKNQGNIAPHEVEKQLLKTADNIDGNGTSDLYGKGRVNAYRAVTE
ncbi:S8 family serine peptidase [Maribellus comscasis]|uniref:S8 family serine peptidase n=1 Tax=Maribellus comscasis TaxID=2681766 RepID=A0A6I6JXQ0_9BACT|nr:S8 family serine peptidase [Maribellus comscasis]QGY42474.1 S8 family serine peptidase [Maribellus comscasis]